MYGYGWSYMVIPSFNMFVFFVYIFYLKSYYKHFCLLKKPTVLQQCCIWGITLIATFLRINQEITFYFPAHVLNSLALSISRNISYNRTYQASLVSEHWCFCFTCYIYLHFICFTASKDDRKIQQFLRNMCSCIVRKR